MPQGTRCTSQRTGHARGERNVAEASEKRSLRASRQGTGGSLGPLFITIQMGGPWGSAPSTDALVNGEGMTGIQDIDRPHRARKQVIQPASPASHTSRMSGAEKRALVLPNAREAGNSSRVEQKKRKLPPSQVVFFRNEGGPPSYRQNPSPPVTARRHTAQV